MGADGLSAAEIRRDARSATFENATAFSHLRACRRESGNGHPPDNDAGETDADR